MNRNKKIHEGLDGAFDSLIGFIKRKSISSRKLRNKAEIAFNKATKLQDLTQKQFENSLHDARVKLCLRKNSDSEILESLAFIAEAVRRILGFRVHAVQLMGAIAIYRQNAIQMQTGEGKTITAAISAILVGWLGKPVHVVTSNDYLAQRDAELMRPLFAKCGLSVGVVVSQMQPFERKNGYLCDVTYSTSKELLADYLRDNMAIDSLTYNESHLKKIYADRSDTRLVQRGLFACIVDEADSVLADEATVPLIISVPGKNRLLKEAVATARKIALECVEDEHFRVNKLHHEIELTEKGNRFLESKSQDLPPIWQSFGRGEYLLKQSLVAQYLYHLNSHYVIEDGKIVIVDEKSGRLMHGRSWSAGLHQAVEAKEGVEITDVSQTHSKMSFQRFFKLYPFLAGMSGTLQNIEGELWRIYRLLIVNIPTKVPKKLHFYPEIVTPTKEAKWKEVVNETLDMIKQGKAVLIGVRSIKESEYLYNKLLSFDIQATLLNAVRHKEEAQIIENAGIQGRVTIATNMAGRGTDIKVEENTLKSGGLHVVCTERHESRRVDMQLFGRTARQGAVGSGRMILSLEDEVMNVRAAKWLNKWLKSILSLPFGKKVALVCYIYFQKKAEKASSKMRARILSQDFSFSKMISFAKTN